MGSLSSKLKMRAIIAGLVFIACRFTIVLCRARQEDACKNSAGVAPSPTSCSSYYSCNQVGKVQEMHCEEGMLWNKEEQFCDWEENVTCWKDLFWFIRAGIRLLAIAGRVSTKLVDPEYSDNNFQPTMVKERAENGRKFSVEDAGGATEDGGGATEDGGDATEDILDIVNMKHVTFSESDIIKESFANILELPSSVFSEAGSGSVESHGGSKVIYTINENHEKEEENKPVKLSETFKQLFLAQSDTKQPKSATSSHVFNPEDASPSPQTSLPWININWLPDSKSIKE